MKNKLLKLKNFLTTLTKKQKIVAVGAVCITFILIGSLVILVGSNKEASVNSARESSKSKKLDQHLKADKIQKAKSDEQAKNKAKVEGEKKAEAEKQAKIKAEAEAKAKTDSESKAKAEAEKDQKSQAEQQQAQAQAQAVAEQQAQQAQVVQQQDNQVAPSYVAPQNNTGGTTNVTSTPNPTPTPEPAPISDDQKWLNAGYIRAPYPEGSGELMDWIADRGYSGYTGNGEGWIRPYWIIKNKDFEKSLFLMERKSHEY